jgi:hypothetical protein
MRISTRDEPITWRPRIRKNSRYWSGAGGAKGWCILSCRDGYLLRETGVGTATFMVETPTGVRSAKRHGPFESFEAAKAAFIIMCDI